MPLIADSPVVPYHPKNQQVPARICAFWEQECSDGSFDSPVSFGSIGDVDFAVNETPLDLDSAHTGPISTVERVITRVSATLSFSIHEMVGTNVNLALRSLTAEARTVAGGDPIEVFGTANLNLSGSTAYEIAPDAVEVDPSAGTVTKPALTIIRVESATIVDPTTGRGTQYASGTDYSLVQPTTGTVASASVSGIAAGETLVPGEAVTGTAALRYSSDGNDAGGTQGAAPHAGWGLRGAFRITWTAQTANTALPVVGETITGAGGTGAVQESVCG